MTLLMWDYDSVGAYVGLAIKTVVLALLLWLS